MTSSAMSGRASVQPVPFSFSSLASLTATVQTPASEISDHRIVAIFSRRSLEASGRAWTADDVRGAAGLRLYRAVASEHSILAKDGAPDHRVVVDFP
jgi:hypothetical protein